MKIIDRMSLKPGMVLGEDVIVSGNVLGKSGTAVDNILLDKLNQSNIAYVTIIEEADFSSAANEKVLFDENFKAFVKQHNQGLYAYKMLMHSFIDTGRPVDDFLLLYIYSDIKKLAPTGGILMDYIYNMMPNEDELTYNHCLNSALLAGTFADWLDMDEEERQTLILCGFYYDIGKMQMPYELLWKPGKLTEEEFKKLQTHPIAGHNLINNLNLNIHIKNAALMHHEREDGSGYPYHIPGENTDAYAKYMAIVDTYVAMASPRSYRNAIPPLEIVNHFEHSKEKFDVKLLMPLMQRIAEAQIGTTVQLDDDSIWEVLIIHNDNLSHPTLKNTAAEVLDLRQYPKRRIKKVYKPYVHGSL